MVFLEVTAFVGCGSRCLFSVSLELYICVTLQQTRAEMRAGGLLWYHLMLFNVFVKTTTFTESVQSAGRMS